MNILYGKEVAVMNNEFNRQIAEIAARLRALREISEKTAEDTAHELGVPLSDYLAYESGSADIPMSFIFEFAKLFKVDMADILSGGQPMLRNFTFVKKNRGIRVERVEHYLYQHLAYNFANKKAEPFLVTVNSSEDEGVHLNIHAGQEFNYCVEGKLMILIDGQEIIMEPGDSLYFNSGIPHGMRALDGKPAKFIAVIM